MKKFLSLLMMALLCVTTAWGAKYVKVTSTTDLTSESSYLIVYEDGNVAFDSNLEDLDVAKNNKEVEILDDQIDVQDANNLFYFRIYYTENGYTIKDLKDRYIGRGGDSNGLTTSESPLYNSISINSDGDAEIISSGGAHLRYNATSGQERFRYFKSSTYANQKAIQLYKYVDDTPQAEYSIYRTITAQNPNDQGGWLGDWSCYNEYTQGSSATGYAVKALSGDEVTFTAGPNSGYAILPENVSIKDADNNNVPCTFVSTDNDGNKQFKFTMPASDVTISAYFTFYRPTLRIAGRFNGRPNTTWITDDSGPAFKYTYKNENNEVVDNYTLDVYFSNPESLNFFWFRQDGSDLKAAGQSYEGDYGLNDGNLSITHNLGGARNFQIIPGLYTFTVNGDRNQLSITRITPTLTFSPEAGTVETGTTVSATSTLTRFINAIKAVDTGAQGTATVQVSTDNNEFVNQVTLATPGEQTIYGKASIGNIVVTGTANYTVAEFYDITCAVVTDAGSPNYDDNSITADKARASQGELVTLTVKSKSGYDLESVKLNGTAITPVDGVYSFVMPAADANVIGYYTSRTLNITVNNDDAKGVVSEIPATSTVGSKIEFTVTPHTGYTVNSVTYTFTPGSNPNTTTLTEADGEYSFNMPGYDVIVDVTYNEVVQGVIDPLFHETFGDNSGSAVAWDDDNSEKSGVPAVYSGITGYTVTNAKQSKNTQGYVNSGLISSTSNNEGLLGSIIIGPLNVAGYQSLQLTYYWKTGSTGATYSTKAYYATSIEEPYTEVDGSGPNAQTTKFVLRTYNLPAAAEVSNLYLKIEFYTSNGNAYIDEVNLSGTPKKTTLKQIEETNPTGEVTIADDLQVVYLVPTKNVAFARDFAESINPATCPAANATGADAEHAIDFMRYGKIKGDNPQANAWQQNNWVMLDFSEAYPSQFGNLSENCVIKGGTLKGTYNNYTFQISDFTYDADYNASIAVDDYEPNVYCPANFYVENGTPKYIQNFDVTIDGETVTKYYWFMTPKPMEVCTFTWAMYYKGKHTYGSGDDAVEVDYPAGFYMQDGEIPLKGGIGADMTYNYVEDEEGNAMDLGLDDLTPGASYSFTGVIVKVVTGKNGDPNPDNHYPQDGSIRNDKFKVATLNLNPEDESQVITGVSEVKTGSEVVSVTYCDLAGRMSQKPFAGVNIIVTRYSDGTVKTTKAIK